MGRAIDVLISKNSGGEATEAKLEVARELKVPVVILKRPLLPDADREFTCVPSLLAALQQFGALSSVRRQLSHRLTGAG